MRDNNKFIYIASGALAVLVSILVRSNVIPFRYEFPIFFTIFTCAIIFTLIDEWDNLIKKNSRIVSLIITLVIFITFIFVWIFEFIN